MLNKEEISNNHSVFAFLIPQIGREILLRLGWLAELGIDFGIAEKPIFETQPPVYQVLDKLVEVNRGDKTVIYFNSLDDLKFYRKYIYFFSYKDFYYGYTRMNKKDCDHYLTTCFTEQFKPSFRDSDTNWYVLKDSNGKCILVNPNTEGLGHASLFNSYEDMVLEAEAVKEFVEKYH